jgi:tetratricopeptide (TPR) repeat protein/TolB-like protein
LDRPFAAYTGDQPFTFVCYAHEDARVVYPELTALRARGINFWYDEGISAGRNWREEIGRSLLGAHCVLFYVSPASLASDHCNREINLALDEGKRVVPVYLAPTELTPDLKVGLNRVQALWRDGSDDHRERLFRALVHHQEAMLPPPVVAAPARALRRRSAIAALAAAAALLVAFGGWYATRSTSPNDSAQPRPPSVGVRPFTAPGDSPELKRYATAVTEDLRTALAEVRTPLVSMAGDVGTAPDYIIGGGVRVANDRMRISIQLQRASTGQVEWAKTIDEPAAPGTTAEFTRAPFVARMIERIVTVAAARERMRADRTVDAAALEAYFAGIAELSAIEFGMGGDWRVAVGHFEQAKRLDPDWEQPYFSLIQAYISRLGDTIGAAEALPKAHEAVRQLLQIQPGATFSLGLVNLFLDLDYVAAKANFDYAARQLTPASYLEPQWCWLALVQGSLADAINHCNSAMVLSPTPDQLRLTGWALFWDGRYREARDVLSNALRTSGAVPSSVTLATKAYVEAISGDMAAANATIDRALERFGDDTPEVLVGPLARVGRVDEARHLLERALARRENGTSTVVGRASLFYAYFFMGEIDTAFTWLREGIENREPFLIAALRLDPNLEPLRRDARFAEAMARVAELEAQGSPVQSIATSGAAR